MARCTLGPGEILCHNEPTLCQFFSWITDSPFSQSWGFVMFSPRLRCVGEASFRGGAEKGPVSQVSMWGIHL